MRIAIDTTPLQTGHKLRGIGFYTEQLIEALQEHESKHSYYFFTRGQKIPKNVDLVHYPYFDPFFLTLPFAKNKPTVVTVHDLIPIAYPKHFPKGVRGEIKWQIQKKSLRAAKTVITDSKASQRDIHEFTEFPNERIYVIYLAPSAVFHPTSGRLKLPARFVLYVGDVNWNKNVPGLLQAFNIARKSIADLKLVLVGKQFFNYELIETRDINKLIHKLDVENEVVRPGFVKDEELAVIYSLASVYVQPSFAEGFGFPILEAMACGCPVVASNVSSLKEIAGPSRLVDPTNSEDISTGILEVLKKSASEREKLIEKGRKWLERFSWKRVAQETAAVYEKSLV